MKRTKDNRHITRHISFTPQEYSTILQRSEAAGMAVGPFIRSMALSGKVKGYRLASITQHTQDINEIIQNVRAISRDPHRDRWLYEADLEKIDDNLNKLILIETDILELLRRRIS